MSTLSLHYVLLEVEFNVHVHHVSMLGPRPGPKVGFGTVVR